MNNIPKVHKLSKASQLSLLAVVILMGAVFFTVNSAMQQQQKGSHASTVGIISGNTYRFINRCSGQSMDVSGNSMSNGAYIVQWPWTNGGWNNDREWRVTDLGNGYYSIRPKSSNKFLKVGGDSTSSGAHIVQYSGATSPTVSEQWKIVDLGNGYYKVVGRKSGLSIGLSSCTSTKGVSIFQESYNGASRLQWKIDLISSQPVTLAVPTNTPPVVTCTPPPPCLFANPRCMLAVPIGGWCQVTPVPTVPGPTCGPPPECYKNGAMICMMPVGGWCNITPTFSPSGVPTTTPGVPTPTFRPGSTVLNLTVALHGIGMGGDSANPHSQGNIHPLRRARTVVVDIIDAQNQPVMTKQGVVLYDDASGLFKGNVDLGGTFATGLYTVKVKTDQYLRSIVPGIQTITQGQVNTLPQVTLVAGDINGDNAINIIDYNILMGCYSDLLPAANCTAANKVLADLNDDGNVNMFDYNLFLRELTNIGGQ